MIIIDIIGAVNLFTCNAGLSAAPAEDRGVLQSTRFCRTRRRQARGLYCLLRYRLRRYNNCAEYAEQLEHEYTHAGHSEQRHDDLHVQLGLREPPTYSCQNNHNWNGPAASASCSGMRLRFEVTGVLTRLCELHLRLRPLTQ